MIVSQEAAAGARIFCRPFPTFLHPPPPGPSIPDLTHEAQELLVTAAASDGRVAVIRLLGGAHVQAGKKDFVEQNNPRSLATWEDAVRELLQQELLKPIGYKGEWFEVTRRGYEVADLLKPQSA